MSRIHAVGHARHSRTSRTMPRAGSVPAVSWWAQLAVLKAEFTAMVTHELGSPLAACRGFLDMLATGELSKVAGVGLGLYLSRRIMQAHGAELCVDSTPGRGSVFAFDLEVAR